MEMSIDRGDPYKNSNPRLFNECPEFNITLRTCHREHKEHGVGHLWRWGVLWII